MSASLAVGAAARREPPLGVRAGNRLRARGLTVSHAEATRLLLARLAFLELARPVIARALEPFPGPVRTLDALHLASAHFLREAGQRISVASYDARFLAAARALACDIVELA